MFFLYTKINETIDISQLCRLTAQIELSSDCPKSTGQSCLDILKVFMV